ncbi:MAG: hypothetical protein R3D78_12965 [Paracoccaceae bacterium]
MKQHNRFTSLGARLGAQALRRFAREEDGAIIILSIQIFMIMLICTGIAIDIVRQEERRTLIQNTIDRAVLAAADLDQDLDPEDVVADYLDKAGLDYLEVAPKVEGSREIGWRKVTVELTDEMPTIFGPLVGVEALASNGMSQAQEAIGNVEISLVLDISGSMGTWVSYDTRIGLLKTAAKSFVTRMFDTVEPTPETRGRLSISVVPYNQQVVLGPDLGAEFHLSSDHTQNTCADVQLLGWGDTAIDPDAGLTRTMYGDNFDYWGQYALTGSDWSNSLPTYYEDSRGRFVGIETCKEQSLARVLAFSNSESDLHTKINSLSAGGDTAIDVGARWGLALLDPAARPAISEMIEDSKISNDMAGRPLAFDVGNVEIDETALKVLVLMTDGENTRSYSTKPEYRSGNTGLVSRVSATALSTYSENSYNYKYLYYYDPSRYKPYYSYYYDRWYYDYQVGGPLYNISWETVWNSKKYTLQGFIRDFLTEPYKDIWNNSNTTTVRNRLYDEMAIQGEFTQKDANLRSLCATAKDKQHRIVVYTVAVDAPPAGKAILRECASGSSYAYDVQATDMANAFASIASSINALRLTN